MLGNTVTDIITVSYDLTFPNILVSLWLIAIYCRELGVGENEGTRGRRIWRWEGVKVRF